MSKLTTIHELASFAAPDRVVRIPPEVNVPLSPRVSRLLDTAPMQRLAHVSQLGLVSLVYPGATHSRLEHSLGVFRNALLFLQRLAATEKFASLVNVHSAERFLLAALLHDVGHWPFCHPIEDMRLAGIPEHEDRAATILNADPIARLIREDWSVEPESVVRLLSGECESDVDRVLASLLSGPIDVDKMDYLQRDSLHAGVPYGRNFDSSRLVSSLTLHPDLPELAIVDKGRTAAEMMVFSRYIMFSEVYWHHTVRSTTAMLQRAVYLLSDRLDIEAMYDLEDQPWIQRITRMAEGSLAARLIDGIFGKQRCPYKRAGQFSILDNQEIHQGLARRPYWWLVACSEELARRLSPMAGLSLTVADVLIDAPPEKLEVDINVNVVDVAGGVRTLGDVSPVAAALAREQFDNYVKRVRVFVRPDLQAALDEKTVLRELVMSIEATESKVTSS